MDSRQTDTECREYINQRMQQADDHLNDAERVLYQLTTLCPDDAELAALEERHYKLWSAFISYRRERSET